MQQTNKSSLLILNRGKLTILFPIYLEKKNNLTTKPNLFLYRLKKIYYQSTTLYICPRSYLSFHNVIIENIFLQVYFYFPQAFFQMYTT